MNHKTTLLEILMLKQNEYKNVKQEILLRTKETHIYNILDKAKKYVDSKYNEKKWNKK